jgi:hypothetical protein
MVMNRVNSSSSSQIGNDGLARAHGNLRESLIDGWLGKDGLGAGSPGEWAFFPYGNLGSKRYYSEVV